MTRNFSTLIATVNRREFLFSGGAGLAGAIVGYLPIAPIDYSYALGNYMSAAVGFDLDQSPDGGALLK